MIDFVAGLIILATGAWLGPMRFDTATTGELAIAGALVALGAFVAAYPIICAIFDRGGE